MRKLLAMTVSAAALALATNGAVADELTQALQVKKIGSALMQVSKNASEKSGAEIGMMGSDANPIKLANVSSDGYVLIDAVAADGADKLVAMLESLGAKNISSYGRMVSASVPAAKLTDMALSETMAFARPVTMATNAGVVTQQGTRAIGADINNTVLGLDGSGFTVGVLSDSFDCDPGTLAGDRYATPEEDVANGDIPATYENLEPIADPTGCTDEGRAMAQLIVDNVPGVNILFHSAFNGQASFAEGIVELARAGADVIVDDVIYFAEPMFQDGIIAQAADEVSRLGIPYYSSNSNYGRDSFESNYRAVEATIDSVEGIWHDFDEGEGVDLLKTITLNGANQTSLSFQWDSPNFSAGGAGATNDVDVIMFDENGVRVPNCLEFQAENNGEFPPLCQFLLDDGGGFVDGGNGGDAIEVVSLVDSVGGSTVQLGFLTETGEAPGFVKYVIYEGGVSDSEYPINASTAYGHNNAAGSEGVGASAFFFNEAFIGDANTESARAEAGEEECVPACLNSFSSAGGTPILFDLEGNRLPAPEVRLKPGVTASDGGNTSFFFFDTFFDDDDSDGVFATNEEEEFPNFFGTSAAAPNAASVALQMIQATTSPVLGTNQRGETTYTMCRPNYFGGRKFGRTVRVREDRVDARLARGFLYGACNRPETQAIYHAMRVTAKDMNIASFGSGVTSSTFEEIGPLGFDFDSGFGFVDGPAAVKAIKKKQYYYYFPYFRKFD